MVGFVALQELFLFPGSSSGGVLSQTPLPAGNQQPSKLFEISDVHAAFSEVIGNGLELRVLCKF